MPSVGHLDYMTVAFKEAGMVNTGGMGPVPLAYTEIKAYGEMSGGLTNREMLTLRKMSAAYIKGREAGKDEFSIPPWDPEDDGN